MLTRLIASCFALSASISAPAAAETLRIEGIYAAQSDAAAALNSIAVEPFVGVDGARLSIAVQYHLREVAIDGERYFRITPASVTQEAHAALSGIADFRFSDEEYEGERRRCVARDEDGDCTERRTIKTTCLRVTSVIAPRMRLIGANGNILWSDDDEVSRQTSYCPDFDDAPDLDPLVDAMNEDIASRTRFALAPVQKIENIRILERRKGLSGDDSDAFKAAVKLTKTDEMAACDEFEFIALSNPDHPASTFNAGLCAEQSYDVNMAEAVYIRAQTMRNSRDAANSGLDRLASRDRADHQIAAHYGE